MKAFGNPQIVQDVSLTNEIDKHDVNLLSIMINFNFTFVAAFAFLELKMKKNPRNIEYDQQLLKRSVDICRLNEGIVSNYLLKPLFDSLGKNGNFMIKCPFGPAFYKLSKMKVDDQIIPKVLMSQDLHLYFESVIKVKMKGGKKLIHAFTMSITGFVTKNDGWKVDMMKNKSRI